MTKEDNMMKKEFSTLKKEFLNEYVPSDCREEASKKLNILASEHIELKKMKIKEGLLELDHKCKMERELQSHNNIMEELQAMKDAGITTYIRSRKTNHPGKVRRVGRQIKVSK